jgi:YHS domain-containing protein
LINFAATFFNQGGMMIKKSLLMILALTVIGFFNVNQLTAQDKKETGKTKKSECTSEKTCKNKSAEKKDCCKNKEKTEKKECSSDSKECKNKCESKGTSTSKISNKLCPVMGEEVDASVETVEYKGKTIGFCCKKCVDKFKKDPDKYMKKFKDENSKSDKS